MIRNLVIISFFLLSCYIIFRAMTSHAVQDNNSAAVFEKSLAIEPNPSLALVTSISSDGRYVISGHNHHELVLWDMNRQSFRLMSTNANPRSIYFIKNKPEFLWQDDQNQVHITDVSGKDLKTFSAKKSYGERITTDLKHYYNVDETGSVEMNHNEQTTVMDAHHQSTVTADDPITLQLSDDERYLMTADTCSAKRTEKCVNLYDLKYHGLHRLIAGDGKTVAAISPQADILVSGDEQPHQFFWLLNHQLHQVRTADINGGYLIKYQNDVAVEDRSGLLPVPKNLIQGPRTRRTIFSIQYVDDSHYLVFSTDSPYAILYNNYDPWPKRFILFDDKPIPSVNRRSQQNAISSNPKQHLIVMGCSLDSGIVVFRYIPRYKTLVREWENCVVNLRTNNTAQH